jgi:Ca2+-binding RTX toxin-like protein
VGPIFKYTHENDRCAIIAGRLVRDPSLPSLAGRFTYGDFCTGEIRSLLPTSPAATGDAAAGATLTSFSMSSFGEDGCHHLYVTGNMGEVMRIDEGAHPPCVIPSASKLAYAEGDGPVAVDPALQLSDADSTTISGATVAITSGFDGAQDQLSFTGQNGIAGSYDASTGTLTLTGDAPAADYEAALRSVRYENASNVPSTGNRTVTFETTDASSTASAPATRNVAVAAVDDPPVVTTSAGTTPYREFPKAVDPGVVVTDRDDLNLTGARVQISSFFEHGDELLFTNRNGITGTYDSGTGVLTLTGTAPIARYQAALRSVRFAPGGFRAPERAVTFTARDGVRGSNAATRMLASTLKPGACANVRHGTAGSDFLTGTAAGDRLLGVGGRDVLKGLAGPDCLEGGGRSDRLEGDRGDDTLHGGRQGDRLSGGRGDDRISGDAGKDQLSGGSGGDRLFGGRGDDRLSGDTGRNEYHGGPGDDRIEAANGVAERVRCGSGRDRARIDASDRTTGCERVTVIPSR